VGKIMVCTPSNEALKSVLRKYYELSPDLPVAVFGCKEKILMGVDDVKAWLTKMLKNRHIESARVVFSTLSQSSNNLIEKYRGMFEYLIIDEAGNCSTPLALLPITLGIKKVLLVGDTKQLPPLFQSDLIPPEDKISFFERMEKFNPNRIIVLSRCYRCHEDIYKFSNSNFYENKLVVMSNRTYAVKHGLSPIMFLQCDKHERRVCQSFINNGQVKMVKEIISYLKNNSDPVKFAKLTIGIITPYGRQNDCLKDCYKLRNYLMCNVLQSMSPKVENSMLSLLHLSGATLENPLVF
jgi:superfamily I DNA and/or RNA helicase